MPPPSFTHQLREHNREHWDAAVNHRFVDELFAGSIDDQVMAHYLIQDYQFADSFVALLGAAIASADSFAARVRLSQFAAMVTSEENTYFLRSFDHLGHPPAADPARARIPGLDARSGEHATLCVVPVSAGGRRMVVFELGQA